MVITIDGPAGSGKSTAARKLAARLEIAYLDTGAMYRALTLAALRHGLDPADSARLLDLANTINLELDCGPTYTRVRLDGHDVSEAIRSMEVNRATSTVARQPAIRERLVRQQRELGRALGSLVTEGRDQGSVVFPQADAKFVLEATLEKRAERRFQEMVADGEGVDIKEVLDNLASRDREDVRHWEPLLRSNAAIVIDTTHFTLHEVVDRMVEHVQARGRKPVSAN